MARRSARKTSLLAFVLASLLVGTCFPAMAAPIISEVAGNTSNGQIITVSGTGFGSAGPNIVLFDDFEKGTNGNATAIGAGSAQVGGWDAIGELPTRYSNAFAHSGTLSNQSNWADNGAVEGSRWIGKSLGEITQIYFSWWAYVPTNRDIPGTAMSLPNWKVFWLYSTPFPSSDYTAVLQTNSLPVGKPALGDYFGMGALDDQNAPVRADFTATGYAPCTLTKGRWHRFEIYAKGSTTSGTLQAWELNSATARYQQAGRTGVVTIHSGETWDVLHFPGYGRGDSNSQTYYDDIYVATGPGALARIEIGDNSIYSNCTNLSIITPTSWSDQQITATVRQGSFKTGAAYLFVINANGDASSGKAITIGGGDSTPQPPQGLRIMNP